MISSSRLQRSSTPSFYYLPLLLLLNLLIISGTTNASPINSQASQAVAARSATSPNLHSRADVKLGKITVKDTDEFYGLRVVDKAKAKEYNDAGILTAIPATGKTLGEGAYLAPGSSSRPPMVTNPWVCAIFGNKQKVLGTPKLYVSFATLPSEVHEDALHGWLQNMVSAASAKHKQPSMKLGETLLFSSGQMVIPPHFLAHSKSYPHAPSGSNSLELKVHCVPSSQVTKLPPAESKYFQSSQADWKSWKVTDWPNW